MDMDCEVRVLRNVWENFPEDVRQLLVSFMGYKSYIRCRQVCRQWAVSIGKTVSECRVPIELQSPDDSSSAPNLKIAQAAFPSARMMLVPRAHFAWSQFLELPLPKRLLEDLQPVKKLAVLDSSRYWSIEEFASLTGLESLRLNCTFRPCGLNKVALQLTSLTELHLFTNTSNFVAVTWGSLHLDCIRYLRNLRHLELGRLDHCYLDDDFLEAISQLARLQHLSLHTDWPSSRKDWPVTTNGIQHLAALTSLTHLRTPLFCYPIPGSTAAEPQYNLDALTWHQAWREVMLCMPHLRRLHIVVPSPAEDAVTAVASCHDLATLTLQVQNTKSFAHMPTPSTSSSLPAPSPLSQQLFALLGQEARDFLMRAKLVIQTPAVDVHLVLLHHHGVSLVCKEPFPMQISGGAFPGSTASQGGPIYYREEPPPGMSTRSASSVAPPLRLPEPAAEPNNSLAQPGPSQPQLSPFLPSQFWHDPLLPGPSNPPSPGPLSAGASSSRHGMLWQSPTSPVHPGQSSTPPSANNWRSLAGDNLFLMDLAATGVSEPTSDEDDDFPFSPFELPDLPSPAARPGPSEPPPQQPPRHAQRSSSALFHNSFRSRYHAPAPPQADASRLSGTSRHDWIRAQIVRLEDELGTAVSDEEGTGRRRGAEEGPTASRHSRIMARLLHRLSREPHHAASGSLEAVLSSNQQMVYIPAGMHYRVLHRADAIVNNGEDAVTPGSRT